MNRSGIALATALALAAIISGCPDPRRHGEQPSTNSDRNSDAAGGNRTDGASAGGRGGGSGGTGGSGPQAGSSGGPDAPQGVDATDNTDAPTPQPDVATAPVCGNGTIESGEECDPPGNCPTACPNQGCTRFVLEGSAEKCTARCQDIVQQTSCTPADGCCPTVCNATNDSDCAIKCDNGVREGQETCDPLASCPTTCPPQGCQLRRLVNPGTCTAACTNDRQQTACMNTDGCCPSACNSTSDDDCQPRCGNGAVEPGEACDPVSQCNSRRDACVSNRDIVRTRMGDPSVCTFRCMEMPRPCGPADGQCPTGCAAGQDADCRRPNSESCAAGGECVSGNCVTGVCCNSACDDGCRSCRIGGKVGTCSAPTANETCGNGKDDNCDGRTDENCCGESNQPCCPEEASRCAAGNLCAAEGPANGPPLNCRACGGRNQFCCSTGSNDGCRLADTVCIRDSRGRYGTCQTCGRTNEPCCADERCNTTGTVACLAPNGGGTPTCTQCGGPNEPCCPGGGCRDGRVCTVNPNTGPYCAPCGGLGEACCPTTPPCRDGRSCQSSGPIAPPACQ
jgi:hypothetical protein